MVGFPEGGAMERKGSRGGPSTEVGGLGSGLLEKRICVFGVGG